MSWELLAACRNVDTAVFYPDCGEGYARARRICARCPVRVVCLETALVDEANSPYGAAAVAGMFGGMSPEERRALQRAVA